MNQLDAVASDLIEHIFTQAADMTLATLRQDGSPHASTVNFVNLDRLLYTAISLDSGKAHDVAHDSRVALTINLPYARWADILGVSINGTAAFVVDRQELAAASAALRKKLPAFDKVIATPDILPWPGMLFLRITPSTLALLDYSKGYGHTSYFDLSTPAPGAP